jgi:hypothetical protein
VPHYKIKPEGVPPQILSSRIYSPKLVVQKFCELRV